MVERFYPQLSDKIEVVRQPRSFPPTYGSARRAAARERLGIDPDNFIVVSLGMVGPTKKIDTVLEGFERFAAGEANVRLVLAGDALENHWTARLRARIAQTNGRVSLTGHLPAETFGDYAEACDVAVQLRSTTRGETSAAVLQLMGCGKQVIVNSFADFAYYPDDVVTKVAEQPDAAEIAAALDAVRRQTAEERQAAETRARQHVEIHHSHETASAAYTAIIRRARRYGSDRRALAALAEHLSVLEPQDAPAGQTQEAATLAESLAPALVQRLNVESRLLIDISHTYHSKLQTGIQRVVREVTRASYRALESEGFNVQAFVRDTDGLFRTADAFALELEDVAPPAGIDSPLTVRPNDRLLMLDSSWFEYDDYAPLFEAVRKEGGTVHTCVYDLVPLHYPELTGEALPPVFKRWLQRAAEESDSFVCISRAVADEVAAHLERTRLPHRPNLQINWFHLGSNLSVAGVAGAEVSRAFKGAPCALMVGTVEVRKRHGFALDVMERLWATGSPVRLVLLGKRGWHVDELDDRIRGHAEYGKRLHWIEKSSDADLAHAYAEAHVLLFPSLYEGYGLPVAEAIRARLPVVASDIPVLREVGGDAALYAGLNDVDLWIEHVETLTRGGRQTVNGGTVVSWDEATSQLRRALLGFAPYRVLP
ncbi:glycosyltransferase [Jiella sp. M17.18]|uniref:glycosyltransferase n=1 Tax=Jiella sp. M17.18 TaxID=3234247 RepID=UPI0034DE0ADB